MNTQKLLQQFGISEENLLSTDTIKTCINEGYLILIKNGEFKANKPYRFIRFTPDYIMSEMKETKHSLIEDVWLTAVDIYERYSIYKKSI